MEQTPIPVEPHERRAILKKIFQALRKSPMFSHYAVEHIRDSAIKAEQMTYDRSRTREDYIKAMHSKLMKIEKSYVMNVEEIKRELAHGAQPSQPLQVSSLGPSPMGAGIKMLSNPLMSTSAISSLRQNLLRSGADVTEGTANALGPSKRKALEISRNLQREFVPISSSIKTPVKLTFLSQPSMIKTQAPAIPSRIDLPADARSPGVRLNEEAAYISTIGFNSEGDSRSPDDRPGDDSLYGGARVECEKSSAESAEDASSEIKGMLPDVKEDLDKMCDIVKCHMEAFPHRQDRHAKFMKLRELICRQLDEAEKGRFFISRASLSGMLQQMKKHIIELAEDMREGARVSFPLRLGRIGRAFSSRAKKSPGYLFSFATNSAV